MEKLWQLLQDHPKPAFSEKVQRGDQGNFFKNRPRIRDCMKRLKALWRKWHYPSIRMLLTCKDWRRFWRIRRLQKCPNSQVMAIFARSLKPARALWRKQHYPLFSMHLKCKHWKTFWRKKRLQTCSNGQVMAIFASSFKSRIF